MKTTKEILWNRLLDGTIQCIATDHAPHTLEAKQLGFPQAPSGMPGVETSLGQSCLPMPKKEGALLSRLFNGCARTLLTVTT